MLVNDKIGEIENSECFLSWKNENPDSYLVHIFRMFDNENKDVWQFGYYNSDDTITTFMLDVEKISEIPEQDIFKRDRTKIPAVDISSIKIDFNEALEKAKAIQTEKYRSHPVLKVFGILQRIKDNSVYNITFVTQTFNTLNIHVDSKTGEILHEKLTSLMSMAKIEKGEARKLPDAKDDGYIG
jgi:hypothetical protein